MLGEMAKAPGGNHSRYYSATERTSLRATSGIVKIFVKNSFFYLKKKNEVHLLGKMLIFSFYS